MSHQASSPVLRASNLHVSYAGNTAVQLNELSIGKGEIVGVIGANGAGKSTLANALSGWSRGDPRTRGEVFLNGTPVHGWPTHQRVRAGLLLVPEGKLIFNQMSVQENLATPFEPEVAPDRKVYSREEIYHLFPRLHERQRHLGSQLSGGERQMLGIGRALMMGPRLLILDEPSIGLAPQLVALVLKTLQTLAREGLSILLVEQNVHAAMEIVDRLVLLERGQCVLEGVAASIKNDPRIAEAYLGAHVA